MTALTIPQTQCTFRPLTEADLPYAAVVIEATGLFPVEMLPEMAEPFFTDPSLGDRWLVAENGGLLGVAYFVPERLTEGTWNMLAIAVLPDRQGQGVGKAFVRRIEDELASEGQRLLLVETSGLPEYVATRGFYVAAGYTEEARIRDFYKQGEDKIVFCRQLGLAR